MSITAQSPFVGHKRLHSETNPEHQGSLSPKRRRAFGGSPTSLAHAHKERRASKLGQASSSLAILRTYFPDMDEKVVEQVLDSCGSNIDEAIKRLNNLQLSANGNDRVPGSDSNTPQYHSPPLSPSPGQEPSSTAADEATPSGSKPAEGEAVQSRTPAQWVEGLVQQMAAAKDINDARMRAANELRALEQAVIQATSKAKQAELSGLHARIQELLKENHVLKRAVAIQQTRLVEASEVNKQQALQAEGLIAELQSKIHALEMSNYSLSMHLRQATGNAQPDKSHPDVF